MLSLVLRLIGKMGIPVGIGTAHLGSGTTEYFNSVASATKNTTGKTLLCYRVLVIGSVSICQWQVQPVVFGFSILSKDFMVDLELSALQAENKGEVISTPRVVICL